MRIGSTLRATRDAAGRGRAAVADEDAGELGAVPLDVAGPPGRSLRGRVAARIHDVDTARDAAHERGVQAVDAGVEKGDRDGAAVVPGQRQVCVADRRRERATLERIRRDRRRIRDTDGIDALHGAVALEQRNCGRIERCGKAGEHAREVELRVDLDALHLEPRAKETLLREHAARPRLLSRRRRDASVRDDAVRERRRLHDDDHSLADADRRALATADEPLPADRGRRLRGPARLPFDRKRQDDDCRRRRKP